MSVLVKGMEMPKSCNDCEIEVYVAKDEAVWCGKEIRIIKRHCAEYEYYHQDIPKPDWCPLVEVKTPHGRLIDADELKKEFPHDTDWEYPVNTNEYVCESIDDMPTVIDAEGETWGST